MKILKKERLDISVLALAAANAIPFVGVIFLGWDAFFIVLLYWSENLVIGLYNILKIAFASVPHPIAHLGKLFLIPFFAAHYGAFTAVHGIFVLAIFNKSIDFEPVQGKSWPCIFVFLQMLINVTILAGGFLAMALGSPAALLTVLVILKTIVDIKFHLRSHKKAQPETDD